MMCYLFSYIFLNPTTSPTYNISVTQITVEKNVTDLNFNAIFDSGTSFTYLNDPIYTVISEKFNSATKDKRHPPDSSLPFEYCYDLSANQTTISVPDVNLTMEGGTQFYITDPIIVTSVQGGGYVYCLGVVKSEDINIIGQNFMTGYRIVFDREKMVLGWKGSDCYDAKTFNTLPVSPRSSPAGPPDSTVKPEATSGNGNGSPFPSSTPPPPSAGNHSRRLNSFAYTLLLALFSLSTHYLIILSS
ncbi:unnamed protein product [Ilex paraguariensis]|uniref:Peptidase A1 domain-containing protein n=1 Tax=Ilex paraguariensis TaxID=185542 RepID=A0ABC8UGR4_9AQUA